MLLSYLSMESGSPNKQGDHDKNSTPVPMPTYHGEMGLTNNWKVNDYELQPQVIRFLTPDTFGLSGRATLDLNNV